MNFSALYIATITLTSGWLCFMSYAGSVVAALSNLDKPSCSLSVIWRICLHRRGRRKVMQAGG